MPKMKSKGAVKVRFRRTKKGKIKCSRPGRGHYRAIRNGSERRRNRSEMVLEANWARLIKKMLRG